MAEQDQDGAVHWQPSNGYIDRLEVKNFKSYRGQQQIGPFRSFTAVVGPNGSGKSNLMDAISFVLGVRTAHLRGSLKELLYLNSASASEEDRPIRGHVKLIYCTDQGEEVTFARHIQPSSSGAQQGDETAFMSVYKVNDRTVTWDAYTQHLGTFGILVKVRNFLVFQGDIEAVAAKSPLGLTTLFEQISGSDVYRKVFDELQKATARAEEKVAVAFSRKKAVAAERKQKKDQKEEAERYLAQQQEMRDLHLEHTLFTLFHLRHERDAARKERAKLAAQATKLHEEHGRYEAELEGIKRSAAAAAKDKLLHEKKMKQLQGERDKKMPDLQRAREAAARLTKRIATQEAEIAELEGKAKEVAVKVAALEKELKAVAKARAKVDAEARAHSARHAAGAGAGLDDVALRAEYEAAKAQVAEQTASLDGQRETLLAQLKAVQDGLQQVLDGQAAHQARADSLRQQAEEAGAAASAAEHDAEAAATTLVAKRAERGRIEDSLRQTSSNRAFLEAELAKVAAQRRDAGSDRREARREARMTEAVAALKRLYPHGVYGRLTDLGKVPRRDYYLALSVAMGRHIDSVVVDTERTARDAIQYLKDQQVPPMTFIPLATVKVPPVNERLRTGLGGTARLALDMVEPERPELLRAFQFAFENTLVCDGLDEARALAYGGAERHKVVSKDGTQFNRAGLITGGDAGSFGAKASRWDAALVARLKEQEEDLERRLSGLPSVTSLRESLAALAAACSDLEAQVELKQAVAKASKERRDAAVQAAATAAQSAAALQGDVDAKRDLATRFCQELQALDARIHGVSDALFAPLSARLGVASIREYEEGIAAFQAETNKKRAELDTKEARIRSQLDFERSKDFAGAVADRKGLLQQDLAALEERRQALAGLDAGLQALTRSLDAAKEASMGAETQVAKAQADLAALRKRGQTMGADLLRLGRAQGQADSAAKAAEATAADLVAAAEVEGLQLPRVAGALALQEVAEALAEAAADGGDEDMADAAAGAPTTGPSSGGPGDVLDSLDYSQLPAPLRRHVGKKEQEATSREMTARIHALQAQLDSGAPNLKAPEQYEAVKERERELTAQLEAARSEARDVQSQFNKCRQSRHDAFSTAFAHISSEINVIYKELTRSSVHPLGGTAYLSLEQPDEPYAGGIKYTAMPPTKRFRDMEQLSGGEKTVAALALLFAIHSFRPSPFFVLDEVDAALDATNVARVAHYIRDKTRATGRAAAGSDDDTAPHFQSIVISLKDIFYEKADVLVGVARDVDQGCSRTFTFDLSAFGDPLPADR